MQNCQQSYLTICKTRDVTLCIIFADIGLFVISMKNLFEIVLVNLSYVSLYVTGLLFKGQNKPLAIQEDVLQENVPLGKCVSVSG